MPSGSVSPTLDVKDAVKIAMDYFRELFGNPFADLALEETDQTGNYFVVTLGYTLARQVPGGAVVVPSGTGRQYKEIKIDATSGEVKSMKVKKL